MNKSLLDKSIEGRNKFLSVLFIVIGAILLLNNLGILSWNFWVNIISLWPIVFIFLGLELMTEWSKVGRIVVRILEVCIVLYILVYTVALNNSGFNSFLRNNLKIIPKENKLFRQKTNPPFFRRF